MQLYLYYYYRSARKSVKDVFKENFDGLFEHLSPDAGKVSVTCFIALSKKKI